ncbi:MAG TPA: FapA family protein [Tepidisphaeraceae bacterium]|nr:FapA family protein [Tepidisphaeraceae bacterium]
MAGAYEIQVSKDRLIATLSIAADVEVSAAEIISALQERKIQQFDDGLIVDSLENRRKSAISVVIATGNAPVDERPNRIDFRIPVADGITCTVAKVEQGQVIGTLLPAIAGVEGRDVFGQPLAPAKHGKSIVFDRNIRCENDQLIAAARGNLRLVGDVFSVEPLLEIQDEFDATAVHFDGDLTVKGGLREGRSVNISGTLTAGGAIEAIQLRTGRSAYVKGGIIGKHKGKYVVGADLRCRFISAATVFAGGNIDVQSEIIQSDIICAGQMTVSQGPIYGGRVAANGGVICMALGHGSGTPTVIEVGYNKTVLEFHSDTRAQIDANLKHIAEVRDKIEPLLRIMKQLTAQQKERATELLCEAEEIETITKKMAADLQSQTQCLQQRSRDEIRVTQVAYPGVLVRFGLFEAILPTALKGPMRLCPRKLGGLTEIVLIDESARTITALPTHHTPLMNAAA